MVYADAVVAAVGLVASMPAPSDGLAEKVLKPITLTDAFFEEHKCVIWCRRGCMQTLSSRCENCGASVIEIHRSLRSESRRWTE